MNSIGGFNVDPALLTRSLEDVGASEQVGGQQAVGGLRNPNLARVVGQRELPEPPTMADLKQNVSTGAKALFGLKVTAGVLGGIVGGLVGLAVGIAASPFVGLYKAGKAIYNAVTKTNLPPELELNVPPNGTPMKWSTAGMPKVPKGTDPEDVRQQLQKKLNAGHELVSKLSQGEDVGRTATSEDVSSIMFFLHARAEEKVGTQFDSGSMTIPDPGGRILRFLDSNPEAYQRPSSHLESLQGMRGGTHRGIDLDSDNANLNVFPKGKGTLLYGRIPGHEATGFAEDRLFLKLEEHGSWMSPVVQRDTGGPSRSMNRHDPGAFLGHSLGFLGSLKRNLTGTNNALGTFKERIPASMKNDYKALIAQAPNEQIRALLSHNDPTGTSGGVRIMQKNIQNVMAQAGDAAASARPFMEALNKFSNSFLSGTGKYDHPELRFGQEIVFTHDELLSTTRTPGIGLLDATKDGVIENVRKDLQQDRFTGGLSDQFLKDLARVDYTFNGVSTKDPREVMQMFGGDTTAARIVTSVAHQGMDGALMEALTKTDSGPFKGATVGSLDTGEYRITKESDDVYRVDRFFTSQPKVLARPDGTAIKLNPELSVFGYSMSIRIDLSDVPRFEQPGLERALGDDFYTVALDDAPLSQEEQQPVAMINFDKIIQIDQSHQQLMYRFIPEGTTAEQLKFAQDIGEDLTKPGTGSGSFESLLRTALGGIPGVGDLAPHAATLGAAFRAELIDSKDAITSTGAVDLRESMVQKYATTLRNELAVIESSTDPRLGDELRANLKERVLSGGRMPASGAAAAMLEHALTAQVILRDMLPAIIGSTTLTPDEQREQAAELLGALNKADIEYTSKMAALGTDTEATVVSAQNHDAVLESNPGLPEALLTALTSPIAEDLMAAAQIMGSTLTPDSEDLPRYGALMTGSFLATTAARMVEGGVARLEEAGGRAEAKAIAQQCESLIAVSTLGPVVKNMLRLELQNGSMPMNREQLKARIDHLTTAQRELGKLGYMMTWSTMRAMLSSKEVSGRDKGAHLLEPMARLQQANERYFERLGRMKVPNPQDMKLRNYELLLQSDLGWTQRFFNDLIDGDKNAPLSVITAFSDAVERQVDQADLIAKPEQRSATLKPLMAQMVMARDVLDLANQAAFFLDGSVENVPNGKVAQLQQFVSANL